MVSLQPLLAEINHLTTVGIEIDLPIGNVTVKSKLVLGCLQKQQLWLLRLCGKPINDIKCISPLADYLDLVDSIPVDYVHAILEGVTSKLTSLWFESKVSGNL